MLWVMPNGRNHMQNHANLRTQDELHTVSSTRNSILLNCLVWNHRFITRTCCCIFSSHHINPMHILISISLRFNFYNIQPFKPTSFKLYSPYSISMENFLQNCYSNNNRSKVQIMKLLIKLISSASRYVDLLAPFNAVHASFVW